MTPLQTDDYRFDWRLALILSSTLALEALAVGWGSLLLLAFCPGPTLQKLGRSLWIAVLCFLSGRSTTVFFTLVLE